MRLVVIVIAVAALIGSAAYYLSRGPTSAVEPEVSAEALAAQAVVEVTVPGTLSSREQQGRDLFFENCAACHGLNAAGSDSGPPLIHRIYEPGHHSDESFYLAAERGVRAHHWNFGDMPPREDVTRAEVGVILAYVRALQRANGID